MKTKKAKQTLTPPSLVLARSTPGFEWSLALYDAPPGTPTSIDELLAQINGLKNFERATPLDHNLALANQIVFNLTHGNLTYFDVPIIWEQSEGHVIARPLPYFQAVIEILSQVEVARIKRCEREQCGNYFYAKPAHKQGCSPKCCNVISATNSRTNKKRVERLKALKRSKQR